MVVKASERFSEAERVANERDHLLKPLPSKADVRSKALTKELEKRHPALKQRDGKTSHYSIIEGAVKDACFFTYAYDGERLVLVINPDHPFYREIYKPLADCDNPRDNSASSWN